MSVDESVDDFTVVDSPEVFGSHLVREVEGGHFIVESDFFHGMRQTRKGKYQGNRLLLFTDSRGQEYQAYSLKNRTYFVFRRAIQAGFGAEENLLREEENEIEGSYPSDFPDPRGRRVPERDSSETMRDLYESGDSEEDF